MNSNIFQRDFSLVLFPLESGPLPYPRDHIALSLVVNIVDLDFVSFCRLRIRFMGVVGASRFAGGVAYVKKLLRLGCFEEEVMNYQAL